MSRSQTNRGSTPCVHRCGWLIEHCRPETEPGSVKVNWVGRWGNKRGRLIGPNAFGYWIDRWGGGGRRRRRELFPSWVWVTLTIDRPPSRNLKKSSSMHTRAGELHRGQKCRQTKISKKSGRKGWEWNMRLIWGVLAFSFGVGCCLVASVLQP